MAARKSDREDGRMENKMEAVIEVQGRTCRINPLDCGVGDAGKKLKGQRRYEATLGRVGPTGCMWLTQKE